MTSSTILFKLMGCVPPKLCVCGAASNKMVGLYPFSKIFPRLPCSCTKPTSVITPTNTRSGLSSTSLYRKIAVKRFPKKSWAFSKR